MVSPLQSRITQNGCGWYWEVILGHEVIANGTADTHAQARAEAGRVSLQETETLVAAPRLAATFQC